MSTSNKRSFLDGDDNDNFWDDLVNGRARKTRKEHDLESDYDSDVEPPPAFLDWRTDPEKNFSDWRIDVIVTQSASGDSEVKGTYHVHKNVLVVESEYFQSLFASDGKEGRSSSFSEAKSETSTIELVDEGAASFEALLDYMYRPLEPRLTTENAVVMHYFGEYFGMKRLRWLARRYWKKDLSIANVATYYKHAGVFLDDKVMHAVKEQCCAVPFLIEAGSNGALLDVADPQLWLYLLKHYHGACSIPLSAFISEFISRHGVDAVTFSSMTGKSVLPGIFFDVAQQLVELERKIVGEGVDGKLSCLQTRCIEALAKDWKRIDVHGGAFCTFLAHQSSTFSAELFKRTLLAARAEVP